ncbi:protein yellow [Anabrus simplex]|uniref:protein yellow n=1 Tax=Anabrus simplex TaxID=316456 RepID=UPI0035A2D41D
MKWCLMLLLVGAACSVQEFREEYIWRSLDFAWPNDSSRARALGRMEYQPENNALAGIKVWRDRIYLTVPRWKPGVPATLVFIPASSRGSPVLQPFPSWDMQTIGNCSALQFVQNIDIDTNGQMWVLDSGTVYTMTDHPDTRCPPKLVVLDLQNSMTRPRVLEFPDSVLSRTNDSILVDLVLDTDSFIYISDASKTEPGIIVFNTRNGQAWKVSDSTMQANPFWDGMVAGKRLPVRMNINALALSPVSQRANRTLFFAPLSSDKLYSISTYALRNKDLQGRIRSLISDLGNKTSFSQGMMVDSQGIMYLGLNSMDAIARWDTRTPLQENVHVFTKDSNRMQWPSTFAIDESGSLWVISNRLQNFLEGYVRLDEINYRVMRTVTNTKSYLYPEETPMMPSDHTDHGGFNGTQSAAEPSDHTDHGGFNHTHNAAARPTSVVLTMITSILTFIWMSY